MNPTQSPESILGQRLVFLLLLGAAAMSVFAIQQGTMIGLAIPLGLAGLILLFSRPDTGTLLFLALAYMNAPVLLGRTVASPQIIGIAVTALIGFPILVHLIRRRGFVFDYTFLLMLLFLGAVLTSTFVAVDMRRAVAWVSGYLIEGVLLYFLLLNAIRSVGTLRAAVWTLVLVSAFLSGLGLYQELTGRHNAQFGGLAQRNTERESEDEGGLSGSRRDRSSVTLADRAGGPLGGPNRFAQILLVVLPLAFLRIRGEKSRWWRLLAMGSTLLIVAGVLITYSRGGFLTLSVLGLLMVLLGYIRWSHVLIGGIIVVVGLGIVAPGFVERVDTLRAIPQLLTQRDTVEGNGAIRGRLTEMLAAYHVFLDYPILGVGPGQYAQFYSMKYMEDPSIAFKSIDTVRRAHCLYTELAAETGLLGSLLFLTIVFTLMHRIWRLRAMLARDRLDLSNLAAGFWLGIVAYMVTAVFLQLAYQRYLWLFLALVGAAIQIFGMEYRESLEQKKAEPQGNPRPE